MFFPGDQGGIRAADSTIAEALSNAGYNTAMFGKWHLGDSPEALPTRHGFDEWIGRPYSNDMDWAIGLSTSELKAAMVSGEMSPEELGKYYGQRIQ